MSAQASQTDRSTSGAPGMGATSAGGYGRAIDRSASRTARRSEPAAAAPVAATAAALTRIRQLRALHGSLAFVQSGGRAIGEAPMCLREHEIPLSPNDIRIGEIGGAPFYVDAEQYERWQRPAFLIDVQPGGTEGFSLDAGEEFHFVTRIL